MQMVGIGASGYTFRISTRINMSAKLMPKELSTETGLDQLFG